MRPHDDHRHFVPEPPLHRAARRGDRRELRRLVSRGADVNTRADLTRCTCLRGLTPLMVAASSLDGASVETLKWLLGHGADLKAGSERGFSAGWYAAGSGYSRKPERLPPRVHLAERLRFLLNAGLDPDERAASGHSLLTEACSAGDPARVKVLLEHGVNPAPGSRGRGRRRGLGSLIPLFCAAQSGSAGCVRLLLDAGADPNTRDNHGTTALFVAGSAAAARALLKAGAKLKLADRRGNDALQEVLESDDSGWRKGARLEVARALVKAGADLERCDEHGHTRLYQVSFQRQDAAVEFLLAAGAEPLAEQPDGETPLHGMSWWDESALSGPAATRRIIDLLVAAGVPAGQPDDAGWTPLHMAAHGDGGNPTAVRALLRHGADPDPADRRGLTPLMLAADRGEAPCIRILLAAGANPRRKDAEGKTALDRAREHHQNWVEINREPLDPSTVRSYGSEKKARASHAEALAQAAKALRILEAASRRQHAEPRKR